MELAAQSIHLLFRVIASTCLIDLYPASAVGSCLMIYKLEKVSDQRFQAKLSSSSPSGNSELKPPYAFGIPNCVNPTPCLQNSSPRNTPLPRNSKMPPVVWYGYFLESADQFYELPQRDKSPACCKNWKKKKNLYNYRAMRTFYQVLKILAIMSGHPQFSSGMYRRMN